MHTQITGLLSHIPCIINSVCSNLLVHQLLAATTALSWITHPIAIYAHWNWRGVDRCKDSIVIGSSLAHWLCNISGPFWHCMSASYRQCHLLSLDLWTDIVPQSICVSRVYWCVEVGAKWVVGMEWVADELRSIGCSRRYSLCISAFKGSSVLTD